MIIGFRDVVKHVVKVIVLLLAFSSFAAEGLIAATPRTLHRRRQAQKEGAVASLHLSLSLPLPLPLALLLSLPLAEEES